VPIEIGEDQGKLADALTDDTGSGDTGSGDLEVDDDPEAPDDPGDDPGDDSGEAATSADGRAP
jgi:hypothetical protein